MWRAFYAKKKIRIIIVIVWHKIQQEKRSSAVECDEIAAFCCFFLWLSHDLNAHIVLEKLSLTWFLFSSFSFMHSQYSIADDVEVVKSVSPEDTEKRDENNDQVALETVEQEQKVHPPPGHVVQVQGEEFIFLITFCIFFYNNL